MEKTETDPAGAHIEVWTGTGVRSFWRPEGRISFLAVSSSRGHRVPWLVAPSSLAAQSWRAGSLPRRRPSGSPPPWLCLCQLKYAVGHTHRFPGVGQGRLRGTIVRLTVFGMWVRAKRGTWLWCSTGPGVALKDSGELTPERTALRAGSLAASSRGKRNGPRLDCMQTDEPGQTV